jgi:cysteine synthase
MRPAPSRPPGAASALDAIGNTPVLRLRKLVPAGAAEVWVKLESLNPTGSYKDRMALGIIEAAERRGDLRPGMTIVEYTGGSTGSSLAFVCAVKGYRCRLVSSDAFAREKLDTMRAFGAELELVPSRGGVITPDLIPQMIERARALAREPNTYFTDQLHNPDTPAGYESLGAELVEQLGGAPDVFCGGVGTGGLLVGAARSLRRVDGSVRIVALEPASAPLLSAGRAGTHHVEGIGIGVLPPLLDSSCYDEVRSIEEADARAMGRRAAAEEGLFAGTSTGLNVVAALALAQELGPGRRVATVACDSGLKYLSGDLFGGVRETTGIVDGLGTAS